MLNAPSDELQTSLSKEKEIWVALAAGDFPTCALTNFGNLKCWDSSPQAYPIQIPSLPGNSSWISVTAGDGCMCGLTTFSDIFCWGANHNGKLELTTLYPNRTWVDVSTRSYTCGIAFMENSTSTTSGNPAFKVIQDNNKNGAMNTPQVVNTPQNIVLNKRARKVLLCVGYNYDGQLNVPGVSLPNEETWKKIAAGGSQVCSITTSGGMICWGGIGIKGRGELSIPTLEKGNIWVSLAAGDHHTCAITNKGSMKCWGVSDEGQTGVPKLDRGDTWVSVAARPHSCGITARGKMLCWGRNTYGQTNVPQGVVFAH